VSGLRIAIIVPDGTPVAGGNWTTALRLEAGLLARGHDVHFSYLKDARPEAADVVHALNARSVGVPLLRAGLNPASVLVTWTGTDLWHPEPFADADRDLLRMAAGHTVLGRDAIVQVSHKLGLPADDIVLVPPGVDTERFSPAGPRVDLPRPTLLLPGAGRQEKGTLDAIDLVDGLNRLLPVHLAIVSPARDPDYWGKVEKRVMDSPATHWYGTVELREMPAWYRAADLVINTSYTEGLSNALLEALACGRPVLARDIPGNRALLHGAGAGRLFRTPTEFVDSATELLTQADAAERLSNRARAHVLRHFTLTREIDRFLALYRRMTESPCEQGAGQ
jgi:glycosyltransferase involved in cell wall biosynthesis